MEQANAVGFVKHTNSSPFSNTFNLGWKNHPNLSWKSGQGQFSSNMQTSQHQVSQVEQAIVNLSKVMADFFGDQKNINTQVNQRINHVETSFNQKFDSLQTNLTQKIDNMQFAISKLTSMHMVKEKGKFPSQL